ncbi:unnamed protein product [Pleuronectes platessa]|uniref:Uncharacterized protein n=1 Tax=Pleuronectes platessa TaxID=8262 RepID=A0A9N7VGQ4_PLEPL|nr:unnamed protein product [Pleuronectes platessa]
MWPNLFPYRALALHLPTLINSPLIRPPLPPRWPPSTLGRRGPCQSYDWGLISSAHLEASWGLRGAQGLKLLSIGCEQQCDTQQAEARLFLRTRRRRFQQLLLIKSSDGRLKPRGQSPWFCPDTKGFLWRKDRSPDSSGSGHADSIQTFRLLFDIVQDEKSDLLTKHIPPAALSSKSQKSTPQRSAAIQPPPTLRQRSPPSTPRVTRCSINNNIPAHS